MTVRPQPSPNLHANNTTKPLPTRRRPRLVGGRIYGRVVVATGLVYVRDNTVVFVLVYLS